MVEPETSHPNMDEASKADIVSKEHNNVFWPFIVCLKYSFPPIQSTHQSVIPTYSSYVGISSSVVNEIERAHGRVRVASKA